eukprot:3938856-Rhodomonas_salina.1
MRWVGGGGTELRYHSYRACARGRGERVIRDTCHMRDPGTLQRLYHVTPLPLRPALDAPPPATPRSHSTASQPWRLLHLRVRTVWVCHAPLELEGAP